MKADIGDTVAIKKTGEEQLIAVGIVVGKALLPANLVPESLLQYEHDPSCRNLIGLFAEMKRIYPGFSEDTMVTVLLFNL